MPLVILPKDEEYSALALKYFREDTTDTKLLLNVEYRNPTGPPAATLRTDKTSDSDIFKNLIKEGLLIVDFKARRNHRLVRKFD